MTQNQTQRIHSLDALRSVMMLLGLVLHTAETYSVGTDQLWPRDPNDTHLFFNFLSSFIHIFRMPIFYFIGGFFGAMLFYERGAVDMLNHRVKRIVLPFLVFLFLLSPIIQLAHNFTSLVFGITLTFDDQVSWLPTMTYHLWFLYYLILISTFTFLLAKTLKVVPRFTSWIRSTFEYLIRKRWLFILLFSITLFVLLVWMWDYWASTPLGFFPDVKLFVFYSLFYLIGWVLYKAKHLLPLFMKNDWSFVISAFVIYTLKFIFQSSIDDVVYGALNTVVGSLLLFGITGLFIRYTSQVSADWRYISDSSYWVYLIHLPLTLFIPGLIVDWAIPSGIKFSIVLIFTSLICFMSYHYLVRSTFIGQFLNGRKY